MEKLSSEKLGAIFVDEAVIAFSFLRDECNYGPPKIQQRHAGMSTDFTSISYSSKSTFFEVFYAHMESEFALQIGLLREKHDSEEYRPGFGLAEALALSAKDARLPVPCTHPRSESALRSAINDLASIVRNHLLAALCNPRIISHWDELREVKNRENRMEETLLAKRKEVEDAWEKRDFQTVVSIFNSFSDQLTALERKQLSYAKKHI
ncbi:MAG TPA: hypothetical protein VGL77_21685 [Armatimonadota bacterium]|jgi:hypothetical protein